MSYSPIEDRYLSTLTQQEFPDAPPVEPSIDGMQLAEVGATKMADYGYSGQRQATMTDYDPTVRERMADFLQAGFEKFGMDRYKARQNAQTLIGGPSSNLPLNTGLADIVPFLGTALQTQEAARMGEESITSAQQGNYGTAAMQAGGAVIGMIPGVAGTVKAGKALAPKAGEMVLDSMNKLGSPVQMNMMPDAPAMAPKPTAPVNDLGFYSAVEQAALNIQRKSGTGQAMLNDITKGQDVKLDEVKWLGLDDFLKGKKNVTREEVQQYIAQNKVDVQEVQFGNLHDVAVQKEQESAGKLVNLINAQEGSSIRLAGTQGKVFSDEALYALQDGTSFPNQFPPELQAAAENYLNAYDATKEASNTYTKFGKYTMPGGENYREILLTMPASGDDVQKLNDISMRIHGMPYTEIMADTSEMAKMRLAVKREYKSLYGESGKTAEDRGMYRSNHWEQPNVLAHIRVNDRVDADGKKMLLVEEVQSDWHQAGRDKGYRNDADLEKQFADLTQQHREVVARRSEIVADPSKDDEYKALAKQEQQLIDQMNKLHDTKQYGVPDAPMKDTWYQLALKRVLKYAADNGYERIGITTGSRQAQRYDLSKQIDAVTWIPKGDGTYDFEVLKDGATMISKRDADATWLKDTIGKELAQKVVDDQHTDILERSGRRFIEGNDLSVGGEGMKKYYDEVYPQFLAKYGKKWGAKVGETSVPTEASRDASGFPSRYPQQEPVRFVDITPEMRQGVAKGQPLFSATATGAGAGSATMQDKEKN